MSKFFGGRSDSESSSSESESSDDEQTNKKPTKGFTAAILFSDDETDDKRVVRSAKEKRYEALYNIIKSIRNSKKIKDFNKMLTSYEELLKAHEKAKPVIKKEDNGVTPRFYVRILVEMEDLINETWEDREGRKNMNKTNGKCLSSLRQKLRKYIRENFDDDMAKFRENPDEPDDIEEEAVDAEDAGDDRSSRGPSEPRDVIPTDGKKKKQASPDDDSDDEWPSDSSESSSSDDDEEAGGRTYTREMFLKKAVDPEIEERKKQKKEDKEMRRAAEKERKEARERDGGSDEEEGEGDGWQKVVDGRATKVAMFAKDAEITHELVIKKLVEIVAARGKKRTNRREQIELLTELHGISEENGLGNGMSIKIKFAIVHALFDYNPKMSDAMKPEYWEKCMTGVEDLIDLLTEHDDITTGEHISEESESLAVAPYKIRGCYLTSVEKLDEEFIKVLKSCDAHSNEYVERLKDEPKIVAILNKCDALVAKTGSPSEVCRVYLKRLEHIYFKFDLRVLDQKEGVIDASEETSLQIMTSCASTSTARI